MGVVLENNKSSIKMGYITFGHIRQYIAYAINNNVGDIYKKLYHMQPISKEEDEFMGQNIPLYLAKFLYHSDCDGYFCKRDVKGIFKELMKLNLAIVIPDGFMEDKYYELLELFSQGERIDLY